MFLTHSVLIESKLFNGGKGEDLPPKSLILLSIIIHQNKSYDDKCFTRKPKLVLSMAYRSVRLVKAEILEGIGPSKPEPCNCLQNENLYGFVCISLRTCKSAYGEGSKLLQFHYTCPIADKIWYPASEVIVTYPPTITKIQSFKI